MKVPGTQMGGCSNFENFDGGLVYVDGGPVTWGRVGGRRRIIKIVIWLGEIFIFVENQLVYDSTEVEETYSPRCVCC